MKVILKIGCKIFICFLVVLFPYLLLAQPNNKIHFQHLGIGDGLPQSTVACMAQDSMGFIWFGTMGGICRYDGYHFKLYSHVLKQSFSLPNNDIRSICILSNKYMLVGTANALLLFDMKYEKFHLVKDSKDIECRKILKTKNGEIWVATNKGLRKYIQNDNELYTPKVFQDKYFYSDVLSLDEGIEGKIWISDNKMGLFCFNYQKNEFENIPENINIKIKQLTSSINVIHKDQEDNLWLGTLGGQVLCLKEKVNKCSFIPIEKDQITRIRALLCTKKNLWIAARNGLFKYDITTHHLISYKSEKYNGLSISSSSTCSLLEDRSGTIWVGSYIGGVNYFSSNNSNNYIYINDHIPSGGLTNQTIYSFANDSLRKGIWIGTGGGGLNFLNIEKDSILHFPLFKSNTSIDYSYIEAISVLPNHNLLIGTLEGLFLFDPKVRKVEDVLVRNAAKRNYAIFSLLNDDRGTWIGTHLGLFYREFNGKIIHYESNSATVSKMQKGEITALCKDKNGGVWVGKNNGLSYKIPNKNSFVNYGDVEFLKAQFINAIKQDKWGNIWIGTDENGLIVYENSTKKFISINLLLGVNIKFARGLLFDKLGDLWVSSINEIWKVKYMDVGIGIKGHSFIVTKELGSKNGLTNNEFSRAAINTTINKDDYMLFGGYEGGVMFNPFLLKKNTFVPPVVLTDFVIFNKEYIGKHSDNTISIPFLKNVQLKYNQAYFTIQFSALNFIQSKSNHYAYKMEGLKNDDWHYVGAQREATYTNLPSGKYTFLVKSANNDGLWNSQPLKINIEILPPIWWTWYAYLFYIMLVSVILYFVILSYKKTNQLKTKLAVQNLRNEMDNEFAEKKINFYTNLSHEIKTPLSLIVAPLDKIMDMISLDETRNHKLFPYLSIIRRNSEKLMKLVRQLLDYRRLEAGHMQLDLKVDDFTKFVDGIVSDFQFLAHTKHIVLQFHTNTKLMLYAFDKEKMEQILNNLLSNALKFTPNGGKVSVRLHSLIKDDGKEKIILSVEDNGFGIPKNLLENLFQPFHYYDKNTANGSGIGLTYTKALVELHQGSILVESEYNITKFRGKTKFTLTFLKPQEELPITDLSVIDDKIADEYAGLNSMQDAQNSKVMKEKRVFENSLLIVDDNEDMLFFLAEHFRETYNVFTATDAESGWEITQNHIPDIILSDLMMPGMDGIAFCKIVKSNPSTFHIPFLLLTAKDTDESKIIGFKTGADDYICKPFNIKIIEARLENIFLNRRRLQNTHNENIVKYIINGQEVAFNDDFLKQVVDFIYSNILEPELNVEKLSQYLHMSRITLYRKMKSLTGLTVIEFIRNIRIYKASQMLIEKKYTIAEICYAVGFSDQDYFRNAFKSIFHVLPSDYVNSRH